MIFYLYFSSNSLIIIIINNSLYFETCNEKFRKNFYIIRENLSVL
jgi:Ca2+-dependent lipid-binding protein